MNKKEFLKNRRVKKKGVNDEKWIHVYGVLKSLKKKLKKVKKVKRV